MRLTVMTYNIHHGEGTDHKLDLPRIAEIIRRSEADLVALQEVDNGTQRTGGVDQAAELARLTGMHATYGPAMDYQGGKYGNAILSRQQPKSSRLVPLAGSGGKHEPRAVLAIVYDVDDEEIVFASTHLDFMPEPSDRMPQAKMIVDAFAEDARPMILAGDFNCRIDSDVMKFLGTHWTIASEGAAATTAPSAADKRERRIDHVLTRPPSRWSVTDFRVLPEMVASDHRPVLVKLRLHN